MLRLGLSSPFRPVRDNHSAGHRGLHRVRAQGVGSRGHHAARAPRQRASRRPRAGPGLHGPLAGDIRRRSHRLGRLYLRCRRHTACTNGRVRRERARLDGRRGALGVLRRARAARRNDRPEVARPARAAPAASLEPPVRRRHGGGHRGAQRRDRCIRDARGRCPPGAVRRSSLRRSLTPRDEDALRGRVHRDDARVRDRDGARPPGLDPRSSGPALARVPRRDRIRDRPVALGHQGVEPNSTFLTGFADWLHLVAAILWSEPRSLATCVWPLPRTCGAGRSSASRASPRSSWSSSCSPAPTSRSSGSRASTSSGRRRTGRRSWRRSRSSASHSHGARCTISSSGHGSSGASRRRGCAAASWARAPSRSSCSCWRPCSSMLVRRRWSPERSAATASH